MMRSPGSLLRVTSALLVAEAAASPALAVPRYDLAVQSMHAPAHVKLDGRRQTATGHAAVRIATRGSAPAVFADVAALAAGVRLTATGLKGPIVCAPVGIAPAVARRRFPLTVPPGRGFALHYDLTFTCAANPDRAPDLGFCAAVYHPPPDASAAQGAT